MPIILDAPSRAAVPPTPIPTVLPTSAVPAPVDREPAQERLYRKQRLAVSFRLFARLGFDMGVSGHISARDPEHEDMFWVNPMAMHFGQIRVSDLVLVDAEGTIVEGSRPVNKAAFMIHSQLHAARPDVVAAAHAHSLYGKIFSALGTEIAPLTQDATTFYEDCAVHNEYVGLVHDEDEGKRIAHALGAKNNLILANHGILTTGASVESAVWRYIALENSCKVEIVARQAGGARPMPAAVAAETHAGTGSEAAGIYSFEPYWGLIIAHEPDVLE